MQNSSTLGSTSFLVASLESSRLGCHSDGTIYQFHVVRVGLGVLEADTEPLRLVWVLEDMLEMKAGTVGTLLRATTLRFVLEV